MFYIPQFRGWRGRALSASYVIIVMSLLGMEAAAFCVSRCASVTVVGRSQAPFQESLGLALGERIAKLFTDKGVNLKMSKTLTAIKGESKVLILNSV